MTGNTTGSVQDGSNFIANALQSCTKPSIYVYICPLKSPAYNGLYSTLSDVAHYDNIDFNTVYLRQPH